MWAGNTIHVFEDDMREVVEAEAGKTLVSYRDVLFGYVRDAGFKVCGCCHWEWLAVVDRWSGW